MVDFFDEVQDVCKKGLVQLWSWSIDFCNDLNNYVKHFCNQTHESNEWQKTVVPWLSCNVTKVNDMTKAHMNQTDTMDMHCVWQTLGLLFPQWTGEWRPLVAIKWARATAPEPHSMRSFHSHVKEHMDYVSSPHANFSLLCDNCMKWPIYIGSSDQVWPPPGK